MTTDVQMLLFHLVFSSSIKSHAALMGVASSVDSACFIAPCVFDAPHHSVRSSCSPLARRQKWPFEIHVVRDTGEHCSMSRQRHYDLTILIPAYNEENRIGLTLSKYIAFLRQSPVYQCSPLAASFNETGNREGSLNMCTSSARSTGSVSILVVDDGSTDSTAEFVRKKSYLQATSESKALDDCWKVNENVKCISLSQNEGKGAAIERGMQEISLNGWSIDDHIMERATRKIVLVADADGSGEISCLNSMIEQLEALLLFSAEIESHIATDAFVAGYRECKDKSLLRRILSWGFRTAVSSIFIGVDIQVRDTQCGFKLMTVSCGKALYNNLNLRRWTNDVEVIYRAKLMGVPVGECKVPWVDAEGSKLVTSKSTTLSMSLVMLKEIAEMRIQYALGNWRVE
ncbi:hypothetical protein ACHAW6_001146 [Cyclotella cf. meneghiniana]